MTIRPTVAEAIEAVRGSAYEIHDPGTPEHGTRIVHTIDSHGAGTDWQLRYIEWLIRRAGQHNLQWNTRTDRHRLTIDLYEGALHVDTTNLGEMTA